MTPRDQALEAVPENQRTTVMKLASDHGVSHQDDPAWLFVRAIAEGHKVSAELEKVEGMVQSIPSQINAALTAGANEIASSVSSVLEEKGKQRSTAPQSIKLDASVLADALRSVTDSHFKEMKDRLKTARPTKGISLGWLILIVLVTFVGTAAWVMHGMWPLSPQAVNSIVRLVG